MKYIAVNKQQQLIFSVVERPIITASQCLIQIHAIGVNRADILQRQGKYPPPVGESLILGLEVCGEIVACGDNVKNRHVGDKVFGLVAGGGYAQYAAINVDHIMTLPKHFSFAQGAAIAEVFLTAYQSLFTLAHLQNQQSVLIHAGASGVGTAAIQLAKAQQCYVTVTVSSEEKAQACIALGADAAINYNKTDFVTWTKEHHPQGFDVIVDVVAGEYLNKNIKVAALDARIVILALLGGRFSKEVDIAKLLMKRISIKASTLRNRSDDYKTQLITDFSNDFSQLLENGTIKPVVGKTFSWQEAEQAHQLMLANANIGKIVLTVD
ncbi:MAG: NAD(P)H-quinone oxidoreductase [Alteromonadaceae bacterium]|nr:NAD(P)H-quinone oxidoreductase [Alteromonadaceae bacterium]